jgi:hypothetical protein
MTTTKKKTKLALPPALPVPASIDEKAMQEMIGKGLDTPPVKEEAAPVDELKSFTFKIYESELSNIRDILKRSPKADRRFGNKKTKSIHDFVLEAVLEKVQRENQKLK